VERSFNADRALFDSVYRAVVSPTPAPGKKCRKKFWSDRRRGHHGHVFDEGPPPTRQRCATTAARWSSSRRRTRR